MTEATVALMEGLLGSNDLLYVDSDADGRWDRFIDRTQEPHKIYESDGLYWKEREGDLSSGSSQ